MGPFLTPCRRWSGGAMVLGKLPVPGRPTNLDWSRARAYCACSRCGWGCLDIFTLIYPFFPLSPSLWETARYRLKYCLKGPLSPKQPTNQLLPATYTTQQLNSADPYKTGHQRDILGAILMLTQSANNIETTFNQLESTL